MSRVLKSYRNTTSSKAKEPHTYIVTMIDRIGSSIPTGGSHLPLVNTFLVRTAEETEESSFNMYFEMSLSREVAGPDLVDWFSRSRVSHDDVLGRRKETLH